MRIERPLEPGGWAQSRRRTSVALAALAAGCAAIAVWAGPAGGATGATERISVSSAGAQANGPSAVSLLIDLSADGRFATFASAASDLVPGDTNAVTDIFVRDLDTGSVELVSVSSTGAIANGNSEYPALSADGRYVVFGSSATNLVALDENGSAQDIYRHDRQTGVTELVSHGVDGRQGDGDCLFPDVSGDGRYVLFTYELPGSGGGDGPSRRDVFVRDTETGVTELISEAMSGGAGNASSLEGTISANGRFVAFSSAASDLVPSDTNGILDVFVRDLLILKTERVTVSTGGAQSDAAGYAHYVSPGGRYVIYASESSALTTADVNGSYDVFLRDRLRGTTERVSLTATGAEGNQSSMDGFASHDMRYIAFSSRASNLTPGDTNAESDVFVRDRTTGAVERISVTSAGAQASDYSSTPWVDAFGRRVIFSSDSTDLVPGDTNGVRDVILHDRGPQGPIFSDTATSPYRVAAQVLAGEGIVGGYASGGGLEFRPGSPLWRAQFAKMIVGTLGVAVTETLTSPFTDLGPDILDNLYPHEYVAAAYTKGITTGFTATTFGPYRDITRAQVITMTVRAMQERRPGTLITPPAGWTGTLPGTDPTHGANIRIAEYNRMLYGIDLAGWDVRGKANRGETVQLLSNLRELVRD